MICALAAPRATFNWQRRSWPMNKAPDKPRKALGKGLSALLPTRTTHHAPQESPIQPEPTPGTRVGNIPISQIEPNPLQPRNVFDPGRLQELANSIQANVIIQPLIVRSKGDHFELIAGERRLRAAKLAGLSDVPAIVQDYADERMLEIALVENIQREDLNPMETAQALERLAREMHLSHEEIANRTGKDRTTITNMIRLLRLPGNVQLLLAERRLSMGHARAILGLASPDLQTQLAEKASAQGYSVRQVERLRKEKKETREPAEKPLEDSKIKAPWKGLEGIFGDPGGN